MLRFSVACTGTLPAALLVCLSLQANTEAQAPPTPDRALLDQYCVACHNQKLRTAGLMLDQMSIDRPADAPDVWENVIHKLRTGQMPPAGRPRPETAVVERFVTGLEASLDALAASHPRPGPAMVHRLNRTEYANAVADLLGLEIDARALFPADDADHGFDNIAEALAVSPTLIERYLDAAREISKLAIGHVPVSPVSTLYRVSEDLNQDEQVNDDLPFGSRGGAAVHHVFPVDGEYSVRIQLRRTLYGYIRGLGRPHQIDVRVDGARVALLTIGGKYGSERPPASFAGDAIGGEAWEDYSHHADEDLEVRIPVKAGDRRVSASFIKSAALPEGVLGVPIDRSAFNYAIDEMQVGNPGVAGLEITGPYGAAGPGGVADRQRIFVCHPAGDDAADARSCAANILSSVARRAFRRPVSQADVAMLLQFYDRGRAEAAVDRFEAGIRAALVRILIDPEFLFRIDREPEGSAPGAVYRLSDLELASRLSFFLWSSIPDDALLELAADGTLSQPDVLRGQVQRMLADRRSTRSLVDNFASQWLDLRNLDSVAPDPAIFPAFSENLRDAMREETKRFIESQIRDDRSVVDLVRADYTFVNEDLARYYGIPDVHGPQFRRIAQPPERGGGLLGHASLLTVTSYANRTSPVKRGIWVLDKLLDAPPPPPPPDVPALKEDTTPGGSQSVRERLEQHRQNPVCASCHRLIDPLGFSLEHFDAIGRWRSVHESNLSYEEGTPVDASASLADGTAFEGLPGLKQVLESRQDVFAAAVTSRLLTYALGRGLDPADVPAIRKIVRDAEPSDYRWSAIVAGIVNSVPFQMRSARR